MPDGVKRLHLLNVREPLPYAVNSVCDAKLTTFVLRRLGANGQIGGVLVNPSV